MGATDETDNTVSNIGECVDLFAPGIDIPAAGISLVLHGFPLSNTMFYLVIYSSYELSWFNFGQFDS